MSDRCKKVGNDCVSFWCPGCEEQHVVRIVPPGDWGFNQDYRRPTFTPSILVSGTVPVTDAEVSRIMAGEAVEPKPTRCHSYVADGYIEFLADCSHPLAGQTVLLMTLDQVEKERAAGTLFRFRSRRMLTPPQKAWVDALRSLKYPQSRSQLLCEFSGRDWQWSVMGVLCEVAFQHGVCNMEQRDGNGTSWIVYTHAGAVHSMAPPPAVLKWAGMSSGQFSLEFRGETRRFDLAACGMAGLRFSELARIIECEPAGLFPGSQGNSSGLYVLDERELERIWELKT